MARRISPDQLRSEIMGILNEYNNNVTEGTKEAVKKVEDTADFAVKTQPLATRDRTGIHLQNSQQ